MPQRVPQPEVGAEGRQRRDDGERPRQRRVGDLATAPRTSRWPVPSDERGHGTSPDCPGGRRQSASHGDSGRSTAVVRPDRARAASDDGQAVGECDRRSCQAARYGGRRAPPRHHLAAAEVDRGQHERVAASVPARAGARPWRRGGDRQSTAADHGGGRPGCRPACDQHGPRGRQRRAAARAGCPPPRAATRRRAPRPARRPEREQRTEGVGRDPGERRRSACAPGPVRGGPRPPAVPGDGTAERSWSCGSASTTGRVRPGRCRAGVGERRRVEGPSWP